MKLQVYLLTAGNDIVFETLDSVKQNVKIPYNLCVWYHALDEEHKVDLDFYKRLTSYTDDVIMATKNQGCPNAFGYGYIYKDYDYNLVLNDDLVVLEGAVEKMMMMFEKTNKVAYIGEGSESSKLSYIYEVNNVGNLPDWGGIVKREAINECGGPPAFFPAYGFDYIELIMRFLNRGWRVINYQGLFLHGGKNNRPHESISETKGLRETQGASFGMYHVCERLGFNNYVWWSNKV